MMYSETIYALRDATGAIRYVGRTAKPLVARLNGHRYPAHRDRRPIAEWMRTDAHTVTIHELEVVTFPDAHPGKREHAWIAKLREDGCDLLNIKPRLAV